MSFFLWKNMSLQGTTPKTLWLLNALRTGNSPFLIGISVYFHKSSINGWCFLAMSKYQGVGWLVHSWFTSYKWWFSMAKYSKLLVYQTRQGVLVASWFSFNPLTVVTIPLDTILNLVRTISLKSTELRYQKKKLSWLEIYWGNLLISMILTEPKVSFP